MSKDDFEIELGQSVRRHIESGTSPLKDPALAAAAYDNAARDQVPVFIEQWVIQEIERHVAGQKDREVGGVLLGDFYRGDKGSFIQVTDCIAAAGAKGTDVSLTFTHEAWEQVNAEHARRCPNLAIVGWYHSHPGLGVFMSREDEFIHSSYFTDPWHVALVVDPIYHNWGCFKWQDGALQRTGGFYVYGPKKSAKQIRERVTRLGQSRQAAPVSASASADRRLKAKASPLLWALVVLLLISQAITLCLLLNRPAPVTTPDYKADAMRLLGASDLAGGETYLRMHLLAHPDDPAAYKELTRVQRAESAAGETAESRRLDLINFSLAAADAMAGTKQEFDKPDAFEALRLKTSADEGKVKLEAADPVKNALQVYKKAEPTRAVRLKRAEAIAAAMGPDSGKAGAWWTQSVRSVEEEGLREIAYGVHSATSGYETAYAKLTPAEKAVVKRTRARILKGER